MFDHPFDSAKHMLTRGKDSIADLESALKAFVRDEPLARVIEPDAKPGFEVHKIKLVKDIPRRLADHASDAAGHMRAALDHAAFATLPESARATDKSTHFPISDTAANLEHSIKRNCRHVPPDIVQLFRSFKPYKGGDDAIWKLNQICNANKHRMLTPVGVALSGIHGIKAESSDPLPLFIETTLKWDAAKHEMVVATAGKGSDLKYEIDLTIAVAFREVKGAHGFDAVRTLDHISGRVERIISATEAEAKRLGIVS